METCIADIFPSFYIPEIQKLAFHIPHVRIFGTNLCGNTRCEAFKCRREFQYGLCHYDYSNRVVAIFSHQIQYE